MTSVIAWVAADMRRPTGLYFASDSRRSWEGGIEPKDDCVKLFAVEGTREIFAFAGDATFPPEILGKICSRLEAQPDLVNSLEGPYERSAWVYHMIKEAFNALSAKPQYGFTIMHGTRENVMFPASFHVFTYSYRLKDESMNYGVVSIKAGYSLTLNIIGSGVTIVNSFLKKETKQLGDVSRAQFSAFCASVASNQDNFSGGPIQLVGVLSIKDALHFGVVTPMGNFYRGSRQLLGDHSSIRWRNTEFDDVTVHGELKQRGATRH
jgi:hypothetical protein